MLLLLIVGDKAKRRVKNSPIFLQLREVKISVVSVVVVRHGHGVGGEARHGPQHAPSPAGAAVALVLRARHIQASGIFGGARRSAARAHALPSDLLGRWRDLAPEGVEVAIAESFLSEEISNQIPATI